jgi:hypothetical protein
MRHIHRTEGAAHLSYIGVRWNKCELLTLTFYHNTCNALHHYSNDTDHNHVCVSMLPSLTTIHDRSGATTARFALMVVTLTSKDLTCIAELTYEYHDSKLCAVLKQVPVSNVAGFILST